MTETGVNSSMVRELFSEFREAGMDLSADSFTAAISAWRAAMPDVPATCGCGAPMRRWEVLNNKCNACRLIDLRQLREEWNTHD